MKITQLDQFVYGQAPVPVRCGRDVHIGAGQVIPEVNFTLPTMEISDQTWCAVIDQYTEMITGVLKRAVELDVPQLIIEFETLPDMTINPKWGLEINRLLANHLDDYHQKHGLKSALRLTPNDIREFDRPPLMRQGKHWESMLELFEQAAEYGADMLSIESTGGKEVCDEALLSADLPGVVFALGVLGCRDMSFLWSHMVDICKRTNIIPAGDSACGFANTAMVLAEQNMIPRLFAAVVRLATVPRALVAVTEGAQGPSKDCAYEGPYLKAMAGIPISMEGRSAACAHFSQIGNISQCVCDCWSNESVQNIQMLSGRAPVVSLEQLAYDCRLLNSASVKPEHALLMRDWLVDSDAKLDVQAYVLRPDVVLRVSEKILSTNDPYQQTVIAVQSAMSEIKAGVKDGLVQLPEREEPWLNILDAAASELPDEETLIQQYAKQIDASKCRLDEYGLECLTK